MNPRSIKFRLVAWYGGWVTILFIVFGFFVYGSLGYYLKEALREALARRARQVADLVQRSTLPWERLGDEIHSHFAPEVNNRLTRVTVDGEIKYVSGAPGDRSFDPGSVPPATTGKSGESFERRISSDGRVLFVVVLTRITPTRTFIVEEGSAEAPITNTLHAWLAVLVAGLAILIIGAALGGVWLARRALQPVDQIILTAERVSSRNLSDRLPVSNTGDELERLSVALNNMIRRLDDAVQHSRRFLADASHELRTPLTMMNAELEALIERSKDRPDICATVTSALEEVARLRKIVEGLFAVSRLDAGEALEEWQVLDLGALAATTAEHMDLLAKDRTIALICQTPRGIRVEGDRFRLKQIIVNLLDNALKYTSAGGKIVLRVAEQNGRAVLEISDTGIGIPKAAIPRVFERFFRVDMARSRDSGGAGLGLAIVKAICYAHGGHVHLESEEGKGTRVCVDLPLAKDHSSSGNA